VDRVIAVNTLPFIEPKSQDMTLRATATGGSTTRRHQNPKQLGHESVRENPAEMGDTGFEHNAKTPEKPIDASLGGAESRATAFSACEQFEQIIMIPGGVEAFALDPTLLRFLAL